MKGVAAGLISGRARRRGSVLILVMTVLGVLFVTGVAFMATMNYEARITEQQQQSKRYEKGLDRISSMVDQLLRDRFIRAEGAPAVGDEVADPTPVVVNPPPAQLQQGIPPETYFRPLVPTFAELPDFDPLLAQPEPIYPNVNEGPSNQNNPGSNPNLMLYSFHTDLEEMLIGPQYGSLLRKVRPLVNDNGSNTTLGGGVQTSFTSYSRTDDADGDGLADTYRVDLDRVGISGESVRELAQMVNPSSNPNGKALVGLRVVPHGAFVNLNQSHPLMINSVFDRGEWVATDRDDRRGPYSPEIEEPSLRRRGFIPPAEVPLSAIQGSSLLDPSIDPAGDGDFGSQMFPRVSAMFPNGESVFTGQHRFWPWGFNEYDGAIDPDIPAFAVLMNRNQRNHDRRSLATTSSHDDLISRGATLLGTGGASGEDILAAMLRVNRSFPGTNCPLVLPFEYPDYPHTIPNGYNVPNQTCDCATDPNCMFDPRKGRLQLSLPWLESGLAQYEPNVNIRRRLRMRLLQDAFTMMLFRSRDPEFVEIDAVTDRWTRTPVHLEAIARTAASLTANVLDFADEDEDPTAVPIRSVDFSNPTTAGRPEPTPQYMFGLERQPFVTELASQIALTNDTPPVPSANAFFAMEIFNPYNAPLDLDDYGIRVDSGSRIQITQGTQIPARGFMVFYSGTWPGAAPTNAVLVNGLDFYGKNELYLTRFIRAYNEPPPGSPNYPIQQTLFEVVVDQFDIQSTGVGQASGVAPVEIVSGERVLQQVTQGGNLVILPWTAPVPYNGNTVVKGAQTLGAPNNLVPPPLGIAPVQVEFANCVDLENANTGEMRNAFPTTGTMLLLMRHANRDWTAFATTPDKLAFTSYLGDEMSTIDNGRMPIFDPEKKHHIDPKIGPFDVNNPPGVPDPWELNRPGELYHLPWGQMVFDYFTALPLANAGPFENPDPEAPLNPAAAPKVDLNGLRVHGRLNINAAPWKALAGLPKVPTSVFAQWAQNDMVSKIEHFAELDATQATPIGPELAKAIVAYREAREICQNLPTEPASSTACEDTTGNFAGTPPITNPFNGRGWQVPEPIFRRGTGFLTVGELANVRHPDAFVNNGSQRWNTFAFPTDPNIPSFTNFTPYAIDGGMNDVATPDYVSAVARLVAMGDWVSVKSHVFTVYTTIRGEPSDTPTPLDDAELANRALRMQETVDRLPLFLGAKEPARIGERKVGRANDALGN